jgi:hypothetical protein
MISAKLATSKGEWTGDCEITEDKFSLSIETSIPIAFSYGVLHFSNTTVPVPVMAGTSRFKDGVMTVKCHRFVDPTGCVVYTSFIEGNDYQYRIDKQSLDLFVKHGVATSKVVDRVLICPECECVAFTIRPGCPSCGSHATRPDQLVHHYACGNVDLLETFTINRQQGSLACGKCHKDGLIINVDYDVSAGLQRCMDCGWTGNNAKLIGRCLCCETTFLVTEAKEINLMEYTML